MQALGSAATTFEPLKLVVFAYKQVIITQKEAEGGRTALERQDIYLHQKGVQTMTGHRYTVVNGSPKFANELNLFWLL